MLRPSEIAARRIDLWIGACLEEEYERVRRGEGGSELLSEILEAVCRLARDAQVSLGSLGVFIWFLANLPWYRLFYRLWRSS